MRLWVFAALAALSFADAASAQSGQPVKHGPYTNKMCRNAQGRWVPCPPPKQIGDGRQQLQPPQIPTHTQGPPTAPQTIPPGETSKTPQ